MTMIIPITDFVRSFGKYADLLPKLDELILTREGRPFATLKATPEEKNKELLKLAGVWKGTNFDNNKYWNPILKRTNRNSSVKF